MRRVVLPLLALFPAATALARHHEEVFSPPPSFALEGPSIGGASAATPTPAYATASRLAATTDGALASDADSGMLLAIGAQGELRASLAIGRDAGLLAFDPVLRRAYVADRRGDRIVVVAVGDKLAPLATWKTPAEPYAVVLVPDRTLVLAAMIADRMLVAYDPISGAERWRVALASEPRGLAVAADGKRAIISYLATGFADELDLESFALAHVALPGAENQHARGAFAATFLGEHVGVVAYQRERPAPAAQQFESTGHYGGGPPTIPPISHHVAFLGERGAQVGAVTEIHEPRALAWDAGRDSLYLAGLDDDRVVEVGHASQTDAYARGSIPLGGKERCGADGLAIRGDDVLVWCSFTRSIATIATKEKSKATRGPELVASSLDTAQHTGLVLFHTADPNISEFGAVACGNCHVDGRADGMSWRINGRDLQTPMLAGRLVGTAPFKWDGTAADLPTSVRQTVVRLGGSGLSKVHLASLVAYLEGLPAVRVPTRNPAAVMRGEALFESAGLGCASCHDGAELTDRQTHQLGRDPASDTPSLVGLAASAPYFHDGSAATLEVVLRERGSVHEMADASRKLTDGEIADLVAFLETR